jgi:hypothetical protein
LYFQLLGTWATQGSKFKANTGKNIKTPISTTKPGMVAYTCDSSYAGVIGRRIMIQAGLVQKQQTLPEK